jgi:hypothetical protein
MRAPRQIIFPLVLWRNQQIVACLVLRLKPKNHRGDFEAQITKLELPILCPKPGNRRPWFCGSTKKPVDLGFEAQPRNPSTLVFRLN